MSDDAEREEIAKMMANGLKTEVQPRADSHERILEIIARLHEVDGDLREKLVISGFTPEAVMYGEIEMACETCMYYLVHRKFCELPELNVPVEPAWSCRLWRI